MPYALIEVNGKQYTVKLGSVIAVDKIEKKDGEKFEIDKVLLVEEDGNTQIGQPYVKSTTVTAEVINNFKGEKIYIKKFKNKVRYRRKTGFRAKLTNLRIVKIGKTELEKKVKKEEKAEKVKEKKVKLPKAKK